MRWKMWTLAALGLGLASAALAQDRPIVAVFDLEVRGPKFDAETRSRLTDYLGSLMARKGFKVVPRSQLKERLTEAKKGTYKECYEETCQIEIGKELAAQKSLASQVLKIGKQCKVTVNLFDLKTAASDGAGAGSGDCDEDGVVKALEDAVDDLLKPLAGAVQPVPDAARPPEPAVAAEVRDGMARIPAGVFVLGCSPGDSRCAQNEKPPHEVWVSELWLDTTEVTVAAYGRCVQAGRCSAPSTGGTCTWSVAGREQHPVNCVDWDQATAYCAWAGKRLPTEAEWEKAARAGNPGARYGELGQVAWYKDNSGGATHPVGARQPNAFGLFDMLGNVYEWCSDWHGESSYHAPPARDPTGLPSGIYRLARGGCWEDVAENTRVSVRGGNGQQDRLSYGGFRCAKPTAP